MKSGWTRRALLKGLGSAAAMAVSPNLSRGAPAIIPAATLRPRLTHGCMSGDVEHDRAVLWARADQPSRLIVELDTNPSFSQARRLEGPAALIDSDFTAKASLIDLPHNTELFYRLSFESLSTPGVLSEPLTGRFRTLPRKARAAPMRIGWSGDLCGQGYGIDESRGGLGIFESLGKESLDFFICSGDLIYADGPIPESLPIEGGQIWHNQTNPLVAKVAETQEEFYARYRYNLQDPHLRRFAAQTPWLVQWDDHETVNNWYPHELIDDPRYTIKSADLLAARARKAFLDYTPISRQTHDAERIFRRFRCGPSLDVFMLDLRSYRGANPDARGGARGEVSPIIGGYQRKWLEQNLVTSRATWKVIASDMPLGLIVPDGDDVDAIAGGDGPPVGRELEIARLLRFIKTHDITGLIWLTADVHYAAAHHYHPDRARFKDFLPFWEFVAGPLNAGNFGPNALDNTFGPKVDFLGIPEGLAPNTSPAAGYQFYGTLEVTPPENWLTVRLHKASGEVIYTKRLAPGEM